MPIANFETGRMCLKENLNLLTDAAGNVDSDNQPMWNVTNALLVVLDSLQSIETRLRRIENG